MVPRMRLSTLHSCVLLLALAACGKKGDDDGKKVVEQNTPTPTPPPAVTCPKGQIDDGGKCVATPVTAAKVDAVKKSADKLAEIDALLADIQKLGAPIELLNAFTKLDAWKKMAAANSKLAEADKVIATLDIAVKQLTTFKAQVAASRGKLTDLSGTLQKAIDDSGAAKTLTDLRTQVSTELKAAIAPLEAEVAATVQKALTPALIELTKTGELLEAGCALVTLSGGSDEAKDLCKQAKDVFTQGLAYVKGLEGKPVTFFTGLVTELDTQIGDLVTAEGKALLKDADARLKAALTTPPPAPAGP
jgi:hypothetical protein